MNNSCLSLLSCLVLYVCVYSFGLSSHHLFSLIPHLLCCAVLYCAALCGGVTAVVYCPARQNGTVDGVTTGDKFIVYVKTGQGRAPSDLSALIIEKGEVIYLF